LYCLEHFNRIMGQLAHQELEQTHGVYAAGGLRFIRSLFFDKEMA
jgi:hypothetical protein